jgi:NADPH:quinone reductase-like Zn-dependent oxidoreductase
VLAISAASFSAADPLSGLDISERPAPVRPDGWVTVDVRAASLNHHDIWSLRGVGLTEEQLPLILGCDAAGVDEDGNEVVVHALVGDPEWPGDETLDPSRTILSEKHPGTFAEQVAVPRRNLVPKPPELSFEEAACLPTAWLTAYRMLFTRAGVSPGDPVLVQGASGGVGSALVALGSAAGLRMWATSRSPQGRDLARELGADAVFEPGERLPERVAAVMETVGEATWAHSLRCLRPGGRIVVAGATTGGMPPGDLSHVFFRQLSVVGSTMGTRQELERLIGFMVARDVRPAVASVLSLAGARPAFAAMEAGEPHGKFVFSVP